jgi:hypothetical protein
MRPLHALLDAMRTRRTDRIGLAQADRLVAGDQPGPHHRGLGDLLAAAAAPARAEELGGEQDAVAAFAAAQRRAAALKGKTRARVSRSVRTVVVTGAAGLALLVISGTAVAARTGSLPDGAQQHAHRLFSALGVPAPRTGPGATPASHPSGTPGPRPSASPSTIAAEIPLRWCRTFNATPGGPSADPSLHRRLAAAAGGAENIERYCARLTHSSAQSSAQSSTGPTSSTSPGSPTPSAASPEPSATIGKSRATPEARGEAPPAASPQPRTRAAG